ncbi:MAG TPA: cysteine desulfurase-like protein [Firmicutes bacterium]|nr:cysteine desulfurase-like protein [Bacillota bacterium]
MSAVDVARICRHRFPALRLRVNEHPVAFFDGPGGTQVPDTVLTAVTRYLVEQNANTHGEFLTSRATDVVIKEARRAVADFLGADPDEIAFGANMTTLNFALSRALGRDLVVGDEVIVTDLDHEANIGPWRALEEKGVVVRSVPFIAPECRLDMECLQDLIGPHTRIVSVGYASNAVGTINDVAAVVKLAHEVGATAVIDAVHYAPHGPIDCHALDTDFLLCSAYKFFGPHVGILYGKRQAFQRLTTYKVRPQLDDAPEKIETGTLDHEGIAGTTAAVDFVAWLGREAKGEPTLGRRQALLAGMAAIEEYEGELACRLLEGVSALPGVTVYGPPARARRTPTVSFTVDGLHPDDIARFLGERGIFVWAGDFYATTLVEKLGLAGRGGLVRVGIAPYNTVEEVDRLLNALGRYLQG